MGQYEYLKLPFGLKNSPAAFMRYINLVFRDLLEQNKILIYIDDILIATQTILIATQTIDESLDILRQVFTLLARNKLELRLDKCYFLQTQINYLGYLVDSEGIRPSNEHVKAIRDYPIPKNVHEVHRFLGLTSYFRKFIPNFSVIASPSYYLTRKSAEWNFGEKEMSTFDNLKTKLSQQPLLCIYSPKAETELHCDASAQDLAQCFYNVNVMVLCIRFSSIVKGLQMQNRDI
ncbi:Reverse transcriptase (RNA-dependent DNA polymerase) [Popillia japonica]|uniref:Reverse transcriptase (RNA-dependent DNA polymerase) n=1 Tax=Popillia japonica TaxID=7064 RepID=A0AAW1LZ64_POPJA